MKTFGKIILTGLALGIGLVNPAHGETLIIKDDFNVSSTTTGFEVDNGVNFGINPPTTRLTGSAVEGVRYLHTVTTRPASSYSIATNSLQILAGLNLIGRFTLSQDGVTPFDFGPALGVASATPQNPIVYDIRLSMRNNNTTAARFSFGLSTEEGNVDAMDFCVQLFRNATANNYYTIAKRLDTGSTGEPDFTTASPKIGTTATNTAGLEFIPFLIRVTDAGAESDTNYNSRIQVSIDNGSRWIYDTATNTVELPRGWRLDGATRYFVFDQAGSAGDFFYDDFSVTLNPSRVKTWTGGANGNWENAGNWAQAAAPITGDALIFNGTTRQTNSNNRGAANLSSVTSITFNNGGFVTQQNPLTVSQAITNLAGNNTINNALTITNAVDIRTEAGALTLGNAVSGTGSIVKNGAGQLILGGTNTYAGNTTVAAGTLLVNGSLASGSAVSSAAGTTLGGSGTVNGSVNVGGNISPGIAAGVLTTGPQTWGSGVTYKWDIANSGADQIVASTLNIQGASVTIDLTALEALTNWNNTTAKSWTLVDTTGGITGFNTNKFSILVGNFTAQNPIGSGKFTVTSDGSDLVLHFVPGAGGGVQILGTQTAGLIQFSGSANTSYTIQYTDSLVSPVTWSQLTTLNSDAGGNVSYQDPQNPRPANRFYRILVP